MSFDNDPRRKQELAGRSVADSLYKNIFGKSIEIIRMERDEELILDMKFGIDVKLALQTGQILLGQEKFLSPFYAKYSSVTVEYEQNQFTKEPGDWFSLAPQFYFVGYLTESGRTFDPWILLNWPNTVLATWQRQIPWKLNSNKDGRARASFKYCQMAQFPDTCVIAQSRG